MFAIGPMCLMLRAARIFATGGGLPSGLFSSPAQEQRSLAFLNVSPSNKAACFLPLRHFDNPKISNFGFT